MAKNSVKQHFNEVVAELAQEHDLPIRFRYTKSVYDTPTVRRIYSPEVVTSNDGFKLVLGTDPDRDDTRQFRIDRITDYIAVDR